MWWEKLEKKCAIQSQPRVGIRREISTSSSKAILLLLTRGHTASTQRTNQGLFFSPYFYNSQPHFTALGLLILKNFWGGIYEEVCTLLGSPRKSLMVLLRLDRESFFKCVTEISRLQKTQTGIIVEWVKFRGKGIFEVLVSREVSGCAAFRMWSGDQWDQDPKPGVSQNQPWRGLFFYGNWSTKIKDKGESRSNLQFMLEH